MKNVLVLVLLALCSLVQAQSRSDDRVEVQKQLLQIEQAITKANGACDYDYFRKIEAEEFIFTDAKGNVTTKAQDLEGEKDCKPHNDQHEFDELRLLRYPEVAVLNARHTIAGERNGKPFRVMIRLTDVFVWRDSRWQLVAGHSSKIPPNK